MFLIIYVHISNGINILFSAVCCVCSPVHVTMHRRVSWAGGTAAVAGEGRGDAAAALGCGAAAAASTARGRHHRTPCDRHPVTQTALPATPQQAPDTGDVTD